MDSRADTRRKVPKKAAELALGLDGGSARPRVGAGIAYDKYSHTPSLQNHQFLVPYNREIP